MLYLTQLWLPILGSAIAVFVASSLVHMVIRWHNSDYRKLPNEDEARAVLKTIANAPGMYFIPHMYHMKEMDKPENVQKFVEGPIAMMTVRPPGKPGMGASLGQWFVLNVFVSIIAAYIASKMVTSDSSFLGICRPVATVTFMSYAVGALSNGIWYGKPWVVVGKELLDAAIYAAAAACVFAWLWPKV